MKKLIICKSATLFFGLLAFGLLTRPDSGTGEAYQGNMMSVGLGLLSAIFGSQWVEYQRRQDEVTAKPTWPGWLRYLLFLGLLPLILPTEAQAQTNYIVNTSNIFTANSGQYNTIVGYNAGKVNTGVANVFVGASAGEINTAGLYNTFLGVSAGASNIQGSSNSFMGCQAGKNNTSGEFNAFVGYQAGYSNLTGSTNAYMGQTAGFSNTTGTGNTFIGPVSGFNNTSGYSNTMLGVRAGYQNQSGSNNLALGDSAGYNNTASGNVMVGSKAGYFNQAGTRNTFLGHKADIKPGAPPLTNATAIGAGALVAISNALVLGDTSLSTKVGIGTASPAFSLDVRGTVNIRNGGLNFANRVKLQADEADYLVLTGADSGQSGLRFAHLTSEAFPTKTTGQVLSVDEQGRVGLYQIGLPASQIRLEVNTAAQWADYVFAPEYHLTSLDKIESFVTTNRHLPGVPSAEVVKRDGIDLSSLNILLLKKVEELTLYLIDQNKQIGTLQQQVLHLSGTR